MDSTAIKALRALEWLCGRESATGVSEMAVALDVSRSNAHRILTTLASLDFVAPLGDGRYEATLKTWELGSAVLARFDINRSARPVMLSLSAQCGETVHLSVLDGSDVVYIDKVDGTHPVRAYSYVGGRAPAYTVATGKALLAFRPDADSVLPKKLEVFTTHTIRPRQALLDELAEIRRRGYATNRGEWREDVGGIGAPIFNRHGEVIAAIGISGPVARLTPSRMRVFAPAVLAGASDVSRQAGYRPSAGSAPSAADPRRASRKRA